MKNNLNQFSKSQNDIPLPNFKLLYFATNKTDFKSK